MESFKKGWEQCSGVRVNQKQAGRGNSMETYYGLSHLITIWLQPLFYLSDCMYTLSPRPQAEGKMSGEFTPPALREYLHTKSLVFTVLVVTSAGSSGGFHVQ